MSMCHMHGLLLGNWFGRIFLAVPERFVGKKKSIRVRGSNFLVCWCIHRFFGSSQDGAFDFEMLWQALVSFSFTKPQF